MNTTPTDALYRNPVPSGTFAYVRLSSDSQAENTRLDVQAERVEAEQVAIAKGTPGDHHGVAREHEAGLSHARWTRTKRVRVPELDFNALRGRPWPIPSSAAADANLGLTDPHKVIRRKAADAVGERGTGLGGADCERPEWGSCARG